MAGDKLEQFGGRFTYIPPFVHQEPSQCTMTAAQMGANVAYLGTLKANQAEVRKLASASGSSVIPDKGYTTRDMMRSLTAHYDLPVDNVGLSADQWRTRLSSGWAGIIAVEYPRLPEALKLDKDFKGGHRLLVVGYNGDSDETLLIDPILREDQFKEQPVKIAKIYRSQGHFSGWQVWVREGQAMPASIVPTRVFDEPLTVDLPPGRTYAFVHKRLPGRKQERSPQKQVSIEVDRKGRHLTDAAEDGKKAILYRVVGGEFPALRGWWLRAPKDLVIEEPAADVNAAAAEMDTTYVQGYLAGVADERAKWEDWATDGPSTGNPSLLIAQPDQGIGKGLSGD